MSAKINVKSFQGPRESHGLSAENQSAIRNPRLLVSEKALRLSCRHAKSDRRPFSCFLLGSFSVDEDEEGVTLTVDRFDPGREKTSGVAKVPTTLLPGECVIPCTIVTKEPSGPRTVHTPDDFKSSFMGLQSHLHSREALDLSKLLITRAHITYTENMDNLHFDLCWAAVTVANTFESTPVKPLPIIPTALARNLSSHNNIAQLQGTHKCGYLTMDQTRKLLLLLESDPKVYTLPLVGIWLSGVTHIHSSQVWACCLRYMFSSSIKERVLSESGSFLIVLYSRTHKEPEFYECASCAGHDPLAFQLLTGEDALHLFKNVEVTRKTHHQFELSTESQNPESFLFNEAAKCVSETVASPNKLSVSDQDSGVEDEDFSPRPSPRPHPSVPQVTRIHPSVPELSLVFGSLIEPTSSQTSESQNANKTILPSPSIPEPERNYFGDSAVKPAPCSINSKMKKCSRGRISPADGHHPATQKPSSQTRRNSMSSSSSLSTPRSGTSPDTSVHHVRPETSCQIKSPQQWPSPMGRSTAHCRQTSAPQSPNYSATFPLQSRQAGEMPKPLPGLRPPYSGVCSCCHNPGLVQCHSTSLWPGVGHVGHHVVENQSESLGNASPTYPNMVCPSLCCSPICVNSCQKGAVKTGHVPAMDSLMSLGRLESLPMNPCSPHACHHNPPLVQPPAHGMLGLSAEAYQLLAEQDKQLKLLQSQIQRLLEAQAPASDSSKPSITSGSDQKQVESVSTETTIFQKKTSVSIAVSTGASLFWNSPYPEEDDSVDQQDDSVLCNELRAAVNNDSDASRTSIASSLKAVDICSFAESSQLTERANGSSAPFTSSKNKPYFPALLRDFKASDDASDQPEHSGNLKIADTQQSVPAVPPEKFYQDLMCQVNNLLKTSTAAGQDSSEEVSGSSSRPRPPIKKKRPSLKKDENSVLTATLKQLKSLGVNIDADMSDVKTKPTDTADNACVLACINPEAVIPRLNYVSFTNIGLSGFVPNGVDLSMEANAIALKYLSESQLTQLSLSHSSKSKALDSSTIASLFPGNTDKSMVGLSLISPSNMSFATKKYLKRYALIDCSDKSDDDDLSADESLAESTGNEERLDGNRRFSASSVSGRFDMVCDGPVHSKRNSNVPADEFGNRLEPNVLRNISNEIPAKSGSAPHGSAPHGSAPHGSAPHGSAPHGSDETALPVLKDLKPRSKVSGNFQFTRHPEKENAGSPLFIPHQESALKQIPECAGSLGDILDVNRLRQLPKLF
uniref:STIL centriolar assembly protein n=1 Tax=Leptobrachium leishanense TaxID=445787 RepID=A0A8C5R145_9ANUR